MIWRLAVNEPPLGDGHRRDIRPTARRDYHRRDDMKQILVIVLLALMLAGCDSGNTGSDYANRLRAQTQTQAQQPSQDDAVRSSFNNGQPGAPTTMPGPLPSATLPPLPKPGEPNHRDSIEDSASASVETVWRDISKDIDTGDAIGSIVAFFGSTPLFFFFCVAVASFVVRRKVRK